MEANLESRRKCIIPWSSITTSVIARGNAEKDFDQRKVFKKISIKWFDCIVMAYRDGYI